MTNFLIDLTDVPYDGHYHIIAGSPAQLIKGFEIYLENLHETETKKKLSGNLLINKFKEILKCNTEKEMNIKSYNLCGHNGRIRSNLGNYPFISGINPTTTYQNANFENFIKLIRHRFQFIANRNIPTKFVAEEDINIFNNFKKEASEYIKLIDIIEPERKKYTNTNILQNTNKDFIINTMNVKSKVDSEGFEVYHKKNNYIRKNIL